MDDNAKNAALLFFLDHLMVKNGRRTIHDLSCQFGARGFTQEMRDAVGATEGGLTDFLSQYPSLFVVEDDNVILKGHGEMDGRNALLQLPPTGRQRDYEREAVEFFEAKLQRFGPELLIKSLLGHRSQAAPEVRLVSGRHLKDFADFLFAQNEHFIVEGDRVRLKNMPEPVGIEPTEERELTGQKAKQAAVDYLRGVLEVAESNEEGPIPLDTFYRKFCERFSHAVRQEVATNPKELLQFLKLNRPIFFIRSNKVSLVKIATTKGEEEGDGSESIKSTESQLGDLNGNGNGNELIGKLSGSDRPTLFPLTEDNLSRIHHVKSLNQAKEVVNLLKDDLDSDAPTADTQHLLGLDFKLVTLRSSNSSNTQGGGSREEFFSMAVLATRQHLAVFDLAHSDSILLESGLKSLLESPNVLKVIHDVRRVSALLAQRYGMNMRRVFDTQVAHAIIQHDKFNKSLAELRAISFVNLQRVYHPQSLMMSDVTPRKLSQTPRPLSNDLILNACEECHCLVTALYPRINALLPETLRPLFVEKCARALIPNSFAARAPISLVGGDNGDGDSFGVGLYRPPATRRRSGLPLYTTTTGGADSNAGNGNGNSPIPPLFRKISAPPTPYHLAQFQEGGGNAFFGAAEQQHAGASSLFTNPPFRPSTHPSPLVNHMQRETTTGVKRSVTPLKITNEVSTQTISTGEITALHIYYENGNGN